MTVQNRLKSFYEALCTVGDCYHYFAPSSAKAPYIVWAEESEDSSFYADDHKQRQALSGYVDFYTQTEFDDKFDQIQTVLEAHTLWTWDSTQYGDPTRGDDNLIHHTWSWRMR